MAEKHSWDVFLQQWHSTLKGYRLQSPLTFTSAKPYANTEKMLSL